MPQDRDFVVRVGSQEVPVPLVSITPALSIALLISVDHGVHFAEKAGEELGDVLAPAGVEMVASVATMGIPLAIEVTRRLGLDDYLILHKTPKIHLGDQLVEPLTSVTTGAPQLLRMDPARAGAVRGRRVAVVDDVISTGGSMRAALALLRRVGAVPVAIGTLVTEGSRWRQTLGADAAMVRSLGAIPVFHPGPQGSLEAVWDDAAAESSEPQGAGPEASGPEGAGPVGGPATVSDLAAISPGSSGRSLG